MTLPVEVHEVAPIGPNPDDVVERATGVANALAKIIKAKSLYRTISGRSFVVCEGWTTLAAMNGVTPHEVSVEERDGIFTATVELRRSSDGQPVGRASAECGAPDELDRNGKPLWSARPRYARRSMALTRATSKACRLTFSWIMALAGYEVTPAEEVPAQGLEEERTPPSDPGFTAPPPGAAGDKTWPFGTKQGTPLKELSSDELVSARKWIQKSGKGKDLLPDIEAILKLREGE
jgi:hypothetical protein